MKDLKKELLFSFLSLAVLFFFLVGVRSVQILKGKAESIPLEIKIDGAAPQILPRIWQNFTQGGEEKEKMLEPVKSAVAELKPSFIRIDHVFDFYNWEELDQRIEEILEVGAIPFISLSYMPPALSQDGSITSPPKSFLDWQNLIQATIERYSGRDGKNISGIYYEVWNEPDLFGQMNPQEYFLLYQYAALGAKASQNVAPFKFGGPAIIGVNKSWLNNFLGLVYNNNLRLDFVSWHSYGKDPNKIKLESQTIDSLSNFAPFLGKVEKIVSEWGSDSEVSAIHDTYFDTSHAISAVSKSLGTVDKLMAFELKDGLDPKGNQFWGRWGLLTHQKVGAVKKPRYFAFTFLNQLLRFFLPASENPYYVYPLASTDGSGNYSLIVTFYPFQGQRETKNLVLKIDNFLPGEFEETISSLTPTGNSSASPVRFSSLGNIWEKNISLAPFSTALINLKRISSATTKAKGSTDHPTDQAAHIASPLPPLKYPVFPSFFENQSNGEISFSVRPFWDGIDPNEYFFFETRSSPSVRIYSLKRKSEGFGNYLDFVFESGDFKKIVSLDISDWKAGNWYKVIFEWDNPKMELTLKVENNEKKETMGVANQVAVGKFIFIGSDYDSKRQINGDIDNLVIKINNQVVVNEGFD